MAEKGLLIIILALVMLKDGSTQEGQIYSMCVCVVAALTHRTAMEDVKSPRH